MLQAGRGGQEMLGSDQESSAHTPNPLNSSAKLSLLHSGNHPTDIRDALQYLGWYSVPPWHVPSPGVDP